MVQVSFLSSSLFLLPIRHDLCFGELLEQHTEELVQLSACKKPPNEWILSSKILFPRVAYGIWSVTLKKWLLIFQMFPHFFCLWKDCFHMFYSDKEFKWNYVYINIKWLPLVLTGLNLHSLRNSHNPLNDCINYWLSLVHWKLLFTGTCRARFGFNECHLITNQL